MAITAKLPNVENGQPDKGDRELYLSRFDKLVDLVVDHQQVLLGQETTIVDLTGPSPEIIREGLGLEVLREAVALQGLTFTESQAV
jgi:tRNA A37 threonylcarbamoyladenosine synthetase subunit TsaC/SUA5/YrdC